MSDTKDPQPTSEQFAGSIIELTREFAIAESEKIVQPDPNVQKYLREFYVNAFTDGAMHVIKNEIDDKLAQTFAQLNRRDRRSAMRKVK